MKRFLVKFLCALLSVVMLACMLPALAVSAADRSDKPDTSVSAEDWVEYYSKTLKYASVEDRLADMQLYYETKDYALYCDPDVAVVAYQKKATGEVLFTNPWDIADKETSSLYSNLDEMMSQVVISYLGPGMNAPATICSFSNAVARNQVSILPIRNGVRVEYAIGEISSRILLPMRIEEQSFIQNIMNPLKQAKEDKKITDREYSWFMSYFGLRKQGAAGIAEAYPVTEKKNINIYVYNDPNKSPALLRSLEALILQYCPEYSFAQMEADYELVEYEEDAVSPPVFRLALEYKLDDAGLSVTLPANGLRYDETLYRITDLKILPYMGATYKGNSALDPDGVPYDKGVVYEGYSFLPDGSGALYDLNTMIQNITRLYGDDYAMLNGLTGKHTVPMRMPVFGQVSTATYPDGHVEKQGYFAIIEQGDAMASLSLNHTEKLYTSVVPSFITRPNDTSKSGWSVYAVRRYTDDYKLRYIILTDDAKAAEKNVSSYYECSWMGMACAYRDYLSATQDGYERLEASDVKSSIPLYIETFGCTDTVKKIMSIPVTVSVALTSFEDIETMYEYLLGEKVTNVQFKLTGYANGGLYSEVPYKLKWEKSVGGKSGFEDLLEYAAEHPEMGLFPDFDFLYTKNSDSSVNMKKYGARTVDNRYTTKRSYSVTMQTLVSHFEMVLSPATFSHFYEKLEKRYAKYGNLAISLSTMGSDLNSSFSEEEMSLREDSKNYTVEALNYFTEKGYDVMVDGGNAYTWSYADYILDVPLDSNRFIKQLSAVPFVGVVLHGYVQFAGSPLNMEGNLTYAMLKAMESGAGVYFILSYANTELLKEDELLSQNYSVRYDIWRARLVEIYNELNEVLHDVQTKLIVGHEFLEGQRVPDEDELLKDALAEVEKQQAALKEKLEKTELAVESIGQAADRMDAYYAAFVASYAAIVAGRTDTSALMTAWNGFLASTVDEKTLYSVLTKELAEPLAEMIAINTSIDVLLEQTKAHYNYLVNTGADPVKIDAAKVQLSNVIDRYVEIRKLYVGTQVGATDTVLSATAKEAFINATDKSSAADLALAIDPAKKEVVNDVLYANRVVYEHATNRDAFLYGTNYNGLGVESLLALYVLALDGDHINVKLEEVVNNLAATLTVKPETNTGATGDAVNEGDYKYAIDNDIVYVTYGDYDAENQIVAYKSLILNFNDYAITTTVDGVVYNIAAYGYAVIYHNK